jgi:NitT/TauT family transport system substrate-binding protein
MRTEQRSVAAIGGSFPEGSLLARTDYIRAHPKVIQGLTNAVVKAIKWIQQASADDIVAALPPEIVGNNPKLIAASIQKIRSCYSPDGVIAPDGPQTVLNMLATYNPSLKDAKIDLSQTFTNDFVRKALAQ